MSTSSAAVVFALSSLLFAGMLDVMFKRYAGKERSRGMYVLGIGIVWGGVPLLVLTVQDQPLVLDAQTLGFGLAAGLMVTLSNLLLIESLTHLDVSIGSTIYRLNTVGVVVLSFVFLAETLKPIPSSLNVPSVSARNTKESWSGMREGSFSTTFSNTPRT